MVVVRDGKPKLDLRYGRVSMGETGQPDLLVLIHARLETRQFLMWGVKGVSEMTQDVLPDPHGML